jgi:cell division protein FtsI/penicillin-binding protein 2
MLDTHSLRQMAIGLRMHVTPLQMARVAGVIATGQLTQPYLIAKLNGHEAKNHSTPIQGIPLEQIRTGMNAVVTTGTAKGAFADPVFDNIRDKIYAKTGTAEIEGKTNNVAWLVGYIDVGAIAGQQHPLAFAVKVSDTEQMGGASSAKVLANWLKTIQQVK